VAEQAGAIAALNNVTTPSAYGPTASLFCEGSNRQFLSITGAAVYLRLWQRFGSGRAGGPGVEVFMPPGYYDRTWALDKIEVRSAVAGKPAQVTIHAD
jgi:hypothetical protein